MCRAFSCLLLVLCLSACDGHHWGKSEPMIAGGNITRQAKTLPFDSVAVHGPFDVNVRLIPQQHYINYYGNAALVDLVNYYVQDGVLHILADQRFKYNPNLRMMLTIETPGIRRLHYHGSGKVSLMDINEDHFIADIDGSGYVYLTGKANRFDAQVSGSSHLDAKCLMAHTIFVNTSELAQAEVASNGNVSALAGNSSDIYYYKRPELTSHYEESFGSVMRMFGIVQLPNYSLPVEPQPNGTIGLMKPVLNG